MTRFTFTMTTATLLAGLFASPVVGQDRRLEAAIPFDFQVGKKTLPAGKYEVRMDLVPGTVMFRNLRNYDSAAVIIQREYSLQNKPPVIVFERFGDHNLLSTVWNTGGQGYKVPRTNIDKELAKLMRQQPELREVALTRPAK